MAQRDGLRLPAEIVAESFVPAVRVALARELAERGCAQREIGDFLGVTQAAVSKYLAGQASVEERLLTHERLRRTAERVADGWVAGDAGAYDALDGMECDLCVRRPDAAAARERGYGPRRVTDARDGAAGSRRRGPRRYELCGWRSDSNVCSTSPPSGRPRR